MVLENDRRRSIHAQLGRLDSTMLFHLPTDPRELRNRLGDRTAVATDLRGRLLERLGGHVSAGREGEIQVEGEALERLRALGYVQ